VVLYPSGTASFSQFPTKNPSHHIQTTPNQKLFAHVNMIWPMTFWWKWTYPDDIGYQSHYDAQSICNAEVEIYDKLRIFFLLEIFFDFFCLLGCDKGLLSLVYQNIRKSAKSHLIHTQQHPKTAIKKSTSLKSKRTFTIQQTLNFMHNIMKINF
jgi:hypothetical protein